MGGEIEARGTALIRRTTIELGPLRITREHRVVAMHPDYPFVDAGLPVRTRVGGWRTAGLLGMVFVASAGGLAVAATKVAPRPVYSVSRVVPDRPVHVAPAVAVKRTAAPRTATMPSSIVEDDAASPDTAADTGSRATAIAAALRSGEVQEWYEVNGGIHGFVVAGAEEREGGRTCRALSVLTRAPGGADHVDQRRECLPATAG